MQMMVKEETKLNNTGSTPVIVQRNRPMIPLHAKMMMMIFFCDYHEEEKESDCKAWLILWNNPLMMLQNVANNVA